MVRHNGYRSKTRRRFRKSPRDRGLPGLSKFMIEYNVGDYVDIIGDPTFTRFGFPHRRFHGKTGKIIGQRGRCYEIEVRIGNSYKMIITGKEHIRLNQGYLAKKNTEQEINA
jgi:large subunit ribosomal protein L21e